MMSVGGGRRKMREVRRPYWPASFSGHRHPESGWARLPWHKMRDLRRPSLTSLLFWPQAPRIRLGQTAMTQDEGFEEALFNQPPFLATGAHPPAQALNVSYFSSFLAGITHILGIFVHIWVCKSTFWPFHCSGHVQRLTGCRWSRIHLVLLSLPLLAEVVLSNLFADTTSLKIEIYDFLAD